MSEEKKQNILKLRKVELAEKSNQSKTVQVSAPPKEPVAPKKEEVVVDKPKNIPPVEIVKPSEPKEKTTNEKPEEKASIFKTNSTFKGMPQIVERTTTFERNPRQYNDRFGGGNRFDGSRPSFHNRNPGENSSNGEYERNNTGDRFNRGPREFNPNFEGNRGAPRDDSAPRQYIPRDGSAPRPFIPRDDSAPRQYIPRDGSAPRPFIPRDGSAPRQYIPRDGSAPRPFIPRDGSAPRQYIPRDGSAPRPFIPRDGSAPRQYIPRDGSAPRPFIPRDGSAPRQYIPRDGSAPRPFIPRDGSAPRQYIPRDGSAPRPFIPRDGSAPRFNNGPRPFNNYGPRDGSAPRFNPNGPRTFNPRGPRDGNAPRPFGQRPPGAPGFVKPTFFSSDMNKKSFDDKKKKKNVDKDDRIRDYKFKENANINTTNFVGRVDESHLENHDWNSFGSRKARDSKKGQDSSTFIRKEIEIAGPLSLKEIAAKMAMQVRDVISVAKKAGLSANEKENVAADILHIIVEECGHTPIRLDEQNKAQLEFPKLELDPTKAKVRPPVVVVVGHVDHGKTSLLDAIRKTKMVNKEAGGITQSIGAYQVATKNGKITFIDTPGHEAFTAIRSRGVSVTDIAILVVSSEDSIKPQTIEAIAHIKSAKVPIIVAITKCDLPYANPEKVKQDLLQHEIVSLEFGGDVICIPVSAHKGTNLDKLLEEILGLAEMMELKANPEIEARGVVLESRLNPKIGVLTTLLVQQGTLRPQSFCIADIASGKIKAMTDDTGARIKEALPGMPVEVIGLDISATAGTEFAIINDQKIANDILQARKEKYATTSKKAGVVFDIESFTQESIPSINLILRADTQGSLEALKFAVQKLNNAKSEAKIVLSSIGPAKEGDINLAIISTATIICFNTKTPSEIKQMAQENAITIFEDPIIYNIIDSVEAKLLGLIKPEEKEVFVGTAKIQQIFSSSKLGKIAGSMVIDGSIQRDLIAKVIRNGKLIISTKITSLKRNKDDAKEVKNGFDCGIVLNGFQDFMEGDEINCYKIEYV